MLATWLPLQKDMVGDQVVGDPVSNTGVQAGQLTPVNARQHVVRGVVAQIPGGQVVTLELHIAGGMKMILKTDSFWSRISSKIKRTSC